MAKSKPHWSFWVVGLLALIWNLLGTANFIGQMDPATVAAMPESHRALIETRPLWATITFALAVISGSVGCLLLLFRKQVCSLVFGFSLICILLLMIPSMLVMLSGVTFSALEIVLAFISPLAVGLFLFWYSKFAGSKSWIT